MGLPLFVELEITETEPGFKGDTATGATKPATVEQYASFHYIIICKKVQIYFTRYPVILIDFYNGAHNIPKLPAFL